MPVDSISEKTKEVDTIIGTPTDKGTLEVTTIEVTEEEDDDRETGKIASWRGITILATVSFSHLFDNIWTTSINIAVPHISEEFGLQSSQSWLLAAYTLTFGGFLLLFGVMSDRFGRRYVFCFGMLWLTVFSIACGVSRTGVQCIIFRALQGLGAAASVPSSIGVLSNYFVGKERHRAYSLFGAMGALGFVSGLILGGVLSGTVGWRYIFYIIAPIMFVLAILGWFSFPKEKRDKNVDKRPSLDFLGAALGTSGIVLMTFALSQSEVTGWNKPVIIVTLVLSVLILMGFTFTERKVTNPIMPIHLWKLPSFAGVWIAAFLLYCWWASVVFYLTLICQEVLFLSSLTTGLYMIPIGATGFVLTVLMGLAVEKIALKRLLVGAFLISVLGTIPITFVKPGDSYWQLAFPTSILGCIGLTIGWSACSIALVSAVPNSAKSLAGGLINTAFQIGSGFGLAITSAVNESVLNKTSNPQDPSSLMLGYRAALFTTIGLVGTALILVTFTVRSGQRATAEMMSH
ncbi:MFS general substrate transporter [Dendrothele bispora CBS 962.96]|uniref:MFS general substrate transporter n=1 Tax=Dendrothele bispora (strain CBS 962.96) TaxID=1314807 RepID=A0A4S8LGN6_DENBC|nr:MFS general substrate transporter [Dendrothele bispora CBS 962.96]